MLSTSPLRPISLQHHLLVRFTLPVDNSGNLSNSIIAALWKLSHLAKDGFLYYFTLVPMLSKTGTSRSVGDQQFVEWGQL
jgi:hypothetical protein